MFGFGLRRDNSAWMQWRYDMFSKGRPISRIFDASIVVGIAIPIDVDFMQPARQRICPRRMKNMSIPIVHENTLGYFDQNCSVFHFGRSYLMKPAWAAQNIDRCLDPNFTVWILCTVPIS
jgi:hypothetical protein